TGEAWTPRRGCQVHSSKTHELPRTTPATTGPRGAAVVAAVCATGSGSRRERQPASLSGDRHRERPGVVHERAGDVVVGEGQVAAVPLDHERVDVAGRERGGGKGGAVPEELDREVE